MHYRMPTAVSACIYPKGIIEWTSVIWDINHIHNLSTWDMTRLCVCR